MMTISVNPRMAQSRRGVLLVTVWALQTGMQIGDIVVASSIVDVGGAELSIDLKMPANPAVGLHVGRLLMVDRMIRTVAEKNRWRTARSDRRRHGKARRGQPRSRRNEFPFSPCESSATICRPTCRRRSCQSSAHRGRSAGEQLPGPSSSDSAARRTYGGCQGTGNRRCQASGDIPGRRRRPASRASRSALVAHLLASSRASTDR